MGFSHFRSMKCLICNVQCDDLINGVAVAGPVPVPVATTDAKIKYEDQDQHEQQEEEGEFIPPIIIDKVVQSISSSSLLSLNNNVQSFCKLINLSCSKSRQLSEELSSSSIPFCTVCAGTLNNVTSLLQQITKLQQALDQTKVKIESEIKQAYVNHIDGLKATRPRTRRSTDNEYIIIPIEHSCDSSPSTSTTCSDVDRLREWIIANLWPRNNENEATTTGIAGEAQPPANSVPILNRRQNRKRKRSSKPSSRKSNIATGGDGASEEYTNASKTCYDSSDDDSHGHDPLYIPELCGDEEEENDDFNGITCPEEQSQVRMFGLKDCQISLNKIKTESESPLVKLSPPRDKGRVKKRIRKRNQKKNSKSSTTLEPETTPVAVITTPKKPSSFECQDCHMIFTRKYLLTKHQIDIHIKEYPCFCHICGRRAYTQKVLDFHTAKCKKAPMPPNVSVIMKVGPFKVKCNECGYAAVSNTSMGYHLVSHTKDKQFICDCCGESFKKLASMKAHKLLKHYYDTPEQQQQQGGGGLGSHPYQCSFEGCGRVFGIKAHLQMHEKEHRGELDFLCSSCDFRTVSAGKLNHHVRYHMKDLESINVINVMQLLN